VYVCVWGRQGGRAGRLGMVDRKVKRIDFDRSSPAIIAKARQLSSLKTEEVKVFLPFSRFPLIQSHILSQTLLTCPPLSVAMSLQRYSVFLDLTRDVRRSAEVHALLKLLSLSYGGPQKK
jgi:hypothetical protein